MQVASGNISGKSSADHQSVCSRGNGHRKAGCQCGFEILVCGTVNLSFFPLVGKSPTDRVGGAVLYALGLVSVEAREAGKTDE